MGGPRAATGPRPSSRGARGVLVGMTGVMLAMTWLASALVEVPLIDDWTYAWSVEHFLQTGELRMLEWSAHYPLAPILWGALFSRLLGFSFAVLRLSTVVLAWAGLLAFYGTLRELGIRPLRAGLGTLLLWCNPVFFVLSHSFMTDVPFVSLMNAALLGYVRWIKHGRTWDLGLGSVLALLAFLIRQLGAALAWMAFGRLSTRALAGASAGVAGLSGLVLWQAGALPNPLGVMLTWDELGLSRELIAGQIAHRQLPRWGQGVVLGVSLSGAVGLVAVLWDRLRRWPHGSRESGTVLLLNLFLQSLLFEALWLYYDRYYLPLLPGLTALLVARLRPTTMVSIVGTAGVLLWGTIAVTGTIDQFRYHRTVVKARDWLLRHGVAAVHIDAGYALTGWWLYAHHPTGPPSRGREPDVPWVTGSPSLPYKIANGAEPSYLVVRSFHRPMLWAASDTLYVLEHTAVADHWGLPSLRAREPWSP
jgi:4-amino-4-deoxy-L-arabinose transferase-like glycosyltransferase